MINDLKTLLQSDGFYVKDEWIQKFDQNQLQQIDPVKKKFLETNIKETSEQISDLLSFSEAHRKTKYDYVVQVDEVVDISLQESDRIVFKHSPRGTLKFLLNTGGEHFVAIEKEQINSKSINVFMQPGSKIKIKAGSDLWYGVLFLNNSNVSFLGGHAPDLVEKRRHIYRDGGSSSANRPSTTTTTTTTNTNTTITTTNINTTTTPTNTNTNNNNTVNRPDTALMKDFLSSSSSSDNEDKDHSSVPKEQNHKDQDVQPKDKQEPKDKSNSSKNEDKTSTKKSSQSTKASKKDKAIFVAASPQSSPKRLTQTAKPHVDLNNFELSTSSDDSDSVSRPINKESNKNKQSTSKKPSQKERTSYLKSSDSDEIEDTIIISDNDKSTDESSKKDIVPTAQDSGKDSPIDKKREKLKLTQQKINQYLNDSNDESDIDLSSDSDDNNNSPPREILPPISPSSGVYDMIGLNALPPSKGTEYLVNAKFSKLKDVYLSGNDFKATCDITNGNLSSTVSIDPEILYRGMEISSVEEYRNLDDDDIVRKRFQLSDYLEVFSPPIKVRDLGEQNDNSPRFMLLS